LDGKPDGDTDFERVCQSDGSLKSESSCKDIDQCAGPKSAVSLVVAAWW
jgi:hypothetical protein